MVLQRDNWVDFLNHEHKTSAKQTAHLGYIAFCHHCSAGHEGGVISACTDTLTNVDEELTESHVFK